MTLTPPPDAACPAMPQPQPGLRLEQRAGFVCAMLLCASVFLLWGRGIDAMAARAALLLFPLAAIMSWLMVPGARQRAAAARGLPDTWLWIGLPLAAYFATALASMLIHRDALAVLDKPVRMLLLSVGLFLWLHLRLDGAIFRRVAMASSILAGFLAFGVAMYERFALGIVRVGVVAFPIQYADMAMSLVLIGVVWITVLRAPWLRVLAAASTGLAFVTIWMTGTRGAFLALVVVPWVWAYASGKRLTARLAVGVLAVVVLVLGIGLSGNSGLRDRLVEARTDLQLYAGGHAATSLGMRLQMWDNSLQVFAASPFLGVGTQGYLQSQREGVARGRLDPAILEYNGAHNQFIDALAKGGLLHGLATCAVFLFPWLWFRRRCRQPGEGAAHAVAGFALTSAFPLFALTQHVFNHSTGVMFYAGGVVVFALGASLPSRPAAG